MTVSKFHRAANDNARPLKHAQRRWAENRWDVWCGVNAFLMHLANHAEADATVNVERKHFARVMSASDRSITNYARRLLDEGLIAPTGAVIAKPNVRYAVYRLAPGDEWIDSFLCSRATPSQPLAPRSLRPGTSDARSGKSDAAYKDNYKADTFKSGEVSDRLDVDNDLTEIPAYLEEAFRAFFDDGKIKSYVLPSRWSEQTQTIHPLHKLGYTWFRDNASDVIAELGIRLRHPWKVPAKVQARG